MKRIFRLLLCLINLAFIGWQPVSAGNFDKASFENKAQQYGNKAANLMELSNIAQQLTAKGVAISIPAIFPISHEEIKSFLKMRLQPQNFIADEWQKFTAAQSNKRVLTDEARTILGDIRTQIMAAFLQNNLKLHDLRDQAKLAQFFEANKNRLLMVRSTGREDTATLANAGGNESIASVQPNITAVSQAIGKVIASYFSDKSISQRLLANDQTIFEEPFMPVLLQVMIGEQANNTVVEKIPTSGVMFSQEAEANTIGVVQIQATWGHGEAVVNGLLPVDTFYVGSSDIIHPVIRFKKQRVATIKEEGGAAKLENTTNPPELIKVQSLTNKNVLLLKQASEAIQKYYNQPMDTEFVVQEGKIYLVQTRPIVAQKLNATYLSRDFVNTVTPENISTVDVIGAGGGAVRTITTKDQIIISDNARASLEIFLNNPNQNQIQCVIVGEMAPATSHEATTFRGALKPLIHTKNIGQLKQWLEAGSLVIDPQRGIIVKLEGEQPTLEQGWFSHPIPALLSLLPKNIKKLTGPEQAELTCQEFFKDKKVSELIELIKNESADAARKALCSLRARMWVRILKEKNNPDPAIKEQLTTLYGHLRTSAYEVAQSLTLDRLQRLYAVKFLEAIIYQWPQPLDIVDNYSFGSVLKVEKEEKKIETELGTKVPYTVQFAKISTFALTDGVKKEWQTFIQVLAPEQQSSIAQLVFDLIKFDMVPL
jgi:hypothetical protein